MNLDATVAGGAAGIAGIHLGDGDGSGSQSELPFPAIGRTAWAILEPRSRAGFIPVPVGTARESSPQTNPPTRNGAQPAGQIGTRKNTDRNKHEQAGRNNFADEVGPFVGNGRVAAEATKFVDGILT
jgi:hypothetical protein